MKLALRPPRATTPPDVSAASPSTSFAGRLRRRRVRRARPMLVAVLILALVAGLLWMLLFSSVLAVSRVKVTGTDTLSVDRVRAAANVPIGEPLARIDADQIRARVESLVAVESVDIARCWPDTLCIRVVERTAVAVVDREGRLSGLDAGGIIFRDFPGRPAGLPLVKMRATTSADALAEAADVVTALPSDVLRRLVHLDVSTVDEISLLLKSGATVQWGSADESANKARVLGPLIKAQPDAAAYNVSAPGNPTVTLR